MNQVNYVLVIDKSLILMWCAVSEIESIQKSSTTIILNLILYSFYILSHTYFINIYYLFIEYFIIIYII